MSANASAKITASQELQFVDTNILVYAYDRSTGEKNLLAQQLLKRLWESRTGRVSVQVLQEFYVNITRKVATPLALDVAAQIVSDMISWGLHSPTGSDILSAINLHQKYSISFWDAMIVQSAKQLGCQTIWSEDLSPQQSYEGLALRNPFAAS